MGPDGNLYNRPVKDTRQKRKRSGRRLQRSSKQPKFTHLVLKLAIRRVRLWLNIVDTCGTTVSAPCCTRRLHCSCMAVFSEPDRDETDRTPFHFQVGTLPRVHIQKQCMQCSHFLLEGRRLPE